MSHSKQQEFKNQSYLRLFSYVKPYRTMLIVGIIAGILTGGFLGASFFWLKGFIDPFQKQAPSQIIKTVGKDSALGKRIQKLEDVTNSPNSSTTTTNAVKSKDVVAKSKDVVNVPVSKGDAKQLDSIIHYASAIGINMETPEGRLTTLGLILFVVSFALVWFMKTAATFINSYCMRWVGNRVITDMRNQIFKKLMNQSLIFYGKVDMGQLISRVMQDTDQMQGAVSNNISSLTSAPFQILGCVGYIIFVSVTNDNFMLLGIMMAAGFLMMLPIILVGKQVRKIYKSSLHNVSLVFSRMHEVFTGIVLVKACDTEQKETDIFVKVNDNYFNTLISALKASLLMSPSTEFLGVVAVGIFFIYATMNNISMSNIVMLLVPALLTYQPIKTLAKVNNGIQRCMSGADRFFDLIDTDTALKESSNPVRLPELKEEIKFNNVVFRYDDNGVNVIDGISFSLKRGQMVAVVGETGSGKSTIANLLARFYDVTDGSITYDGTNVEDLKISDIRKLIGVVTQTTILFNDTIASNIAYGNEDDVTQEQIEEAAKRANAHKFIVDGNHAEGYDTVVGEKGFLLSGGEKQRIAIARAILRNPPILILDEATSALDTVTERLVQDALTNLMENRTVIAIAHRLSTIQHADLILVIDKGRIIEAGTHEELLSNKDGQYHYLHEIQFD